MTELTLPWLQELAPALGSTRSSSVSSGWRVKQTLRTLGESPVAWAVHLGQSMAGRMAAEVPGHRVDDGSEVLRMGTESVVLQALLEFSGNATGTLATDDALGGVKDFVQRRLTLDEVLRGVRLGHALLTNALLDECTRRCPPDRASRDMRLISERLFVLFDDFALRMGQEYRTQREEWLRRGVSRQVETVESILQGHEISKQAAHRILHYDIERTHIGLIAWSTRRRLAEDDVVETLRKILREAGVCQSLVVPAHVGVAWGWASNDHGPGEVVESLRSSALPPGLRLCFGAPARGLRGFRESHDDAGAAFGMASTTSVNGRVIDYRDVDVSGLLLENRDRARRFAVRELGALGDDNPAVEDLRRTLAVYLAVGGSPQAASSLLAVSRNTVTYRLHKAEELLGRDVSVRRFQLQAALDIIDTLGL